jgi:coat protein Gp5
MSNTYLTISMITREGLRVLVNNLVFARNINRDYDDQFAKSGAKIGATINIRKPPRYIGRTGDALQVEAATETSIPLTLTTLFGVDLEFSDQDLLLSIDDFKKRFIAPSMSKIANKIDYDGLRLYKQVPNAVGTPGTTPTALLTYMLAGVAMDNESCPQDGQRNMVITSLMQATIVDALKGLFQAAQQIASQYRKGRMGEAVNFVWFMDQNVATHKVGPLGGTPLVNGANQQGSSLITDGWTAAAASRLKAGDIISVANVNGVNPQSYDSWGTVRQFVVTGDVSSDGSGNATIPIYPPMTPSGPFQTIDALAADNAAITVLGAANTNTPQGLAYHPDAFTLGMADLEVPRGTDMAERIASKELGISIRFIRDYDIKSNSRPCRSDVLYGYAAPRPELACRVAA